MGRFLVFPQYLLDRHIRGGRDEDSSLNYGLRVDFGLFVREDVMSPGAVHPRSLNYPDYLWIEDPGFLRRVG